MIKNINLEVEVTEDSRLEETFSLIEKISENIDTSWNVKVE
jgi:hypothetical protein